MKRQLTAATRPLVQLPLVLPVSPVIQGAAHDPLHICLPLSPGCFVSPCPILLCGWYGVCGEDRCLGIPFVPLPSTGAPLCSDADAQAPTREQNLRSCSDRPSLRSFRFALAFSFRALPLHLSISATHRTRLTPPSVFLDDAFVVLASALLLSLVRACAA